MERNYSEMPTSTLRQERNTLEHKLVSARSVLSDIANLDWVTNQKRVRTPSNPRWGERLDLSGLTQEEYFQRLSQVIIPIQLKLQRMVIPSYTQNLGEISSELNLRTRPLEDSQLAITPRPAREITTKELSLINRIIGFVPEDVARLWSRTGQLSPEQYQRQAIALAKYIRQIEEGQETPIQAVDILRAHQDQKVIVAQNVIRQTLAQMVLRSEQQPLSASKNRWGKHIRELTDWLGVNAKQHLIDTVENLSELERALVFEISSVTLLKDLDFIDLYECDEVRFAAYLRGAAFIKENDLRDDTLGEMITTAVERNGEGNLDSTKVINYLLQVEYSDYLFQRLFESAKFGRFRDELMVFFAQNIATVRWSQKVDDSRFSDHLDEEVPKHRRYNL